MVGRDGSIDWLCLPRFDSPACFAALVGTQDNGFWRVGPVAGGSCTRRAYRGETLILESEWRSATGAVRGIDFMPPRTQAPCLVRIVEGLRGSVPRRSDLRLRFHRGRVLPWIRVAESGPFAVAGPDAVWLHADGPVRVPDDESSTVHDFTVQAGRKLALTLVWSPSHLTEP